MGSPRERFERLVRDSVRLLRRRRARSFFEAGIYGLCAGLTVWIVVTLIWPSWLGVSEISIGILAGLLVMGLLFAWFGPVRRAVAVTAIDRERRLPDSAVAASEMDSAQLPEIWREQQMLDTLARAEAAPPARRAAVAWPLIFGLASALVLSGVILTRSAAAHAAMKAAPADPLLAQHRADLLDLFKDWDQAQKEQPDPRLAELLREIQPLRDKIAAGKLDEREMLLQLSKVEDKLAAMQEQAEHESLDPHAAELAEAMSGVQGMEPLAAALKDKDYNRAKDAADKLGDKLSQPDAKTPAGAEQAADRMQQSAQKMSDAGQKSMAEGMKSMSLGAQQKNASKMAEGARKISMCMSQQMAKKSQCQGMALQRLQLSLCKGCVGDKECMNPGLSLLPKLSIQKSKKPGHGAGAETNLARFGAETDAVGAGNRQNITGAMNADGQSETETVKTTEAPTQQTISVATADFAQYRKLSEEAIEDESLPVAHRLTIRRYFESIRPVSDDNPK